MHELGRLPRSFALRKTPVMQAFLEEKIYEFKVYFFISTYFKNTWSLPVLRINPS